MRSIIRELFYGRLSPADNSFLDKPKVKKNMDRLGDLEEQLIKSLDNDTRILFEQFCELETDVSIMLGEERYIDGFKTGMQFAVESLNGNKK